MVKFSLSVLMTPGDRVWYGNTLNILLVSQQLQSAKNVKF
jgi:hypothetical protein